GGEAADLKRLRLNEKSRPSFEPGLQRVPIKEKRMKPQMSSDTKENEIVKEIELNVEELEDRIAPGVDFNHNETLVVEDVIATEIEEVEEIVAPGTSINHNETTVLDDEILLEIEELEEIVAPFGTELNHNETVILDS